MSVWLFIYQPCYSASTPQVYFMQCNLHQRRFFRPGSSTLFLRGTTQELTCKPHYAPEGWVTQFQSKSLAQYVSQPITIKFEEPTLARGWNPLTLKTEERMLSFQRRRCQCIPVWLSVEPKPIGVAGPVGFPDAWNWTFKLWTVLMLPSRSGRGSIRCGFVWRSKTNGICTTVLINWTWRSQSRRSWTVCHTFLLAHS